MSASKRSITRPSCSPAVPDLPRRVARARRPVLAPAIAGAIVVHAASIGALMAFGYGVPTPPVAEAAVEVAMVLGPAPPAPQPDMPTPGASAPLPDSPVVEPAAPPPPANPADTPPPMLADIEPPAPEIEPEPAAAVPTPAEVATVPEPAPLVQTPSPAQQPVRPPPMHPPLQRPPRPTLNAGRNTPALQDSAAAATSARPPAATTPAGAGTPAAADHEAALEARIRDAVQAAMHYPAAARMMNVTGRARVQFYYRSGSVADLSLVQSSGTPMLDKAALAAAQAAHYPPAPAPIEGRLLRLLVWVEFNLD